MTENTNPIGSIFSRVFGQRDKVKGMGDLIDRLLYGANNPGRPRRVEVPGEKAVTIASDLAANPLHPELIEARPETIVNALDKYRTYNQVKASYRINPTASLEKVKGAISESLKKGIKSMPLIFEGVAQVKLLDEVLHDQLAYKGTGLPRFSDLVPKDLIKEEGFSFIYDPVKKSLLFGQAAEGSFGKFVPIPIQSLNPLERGLVHLGESKRLSPLVHTGQGYATFSSEFNRAVFADVTDAKSFYRSYRKAKKSPLVNILQSSHIYKGLDQSEKAAYVGSRVALLPGENASELYTAIKGYQKARGEININMSLAGKAGSSAGLSKAYDKVKSFVGSLPGLLKGLGAGPMWYNKPEHFMGDKIPMFSAPDTGGLFGDRALTASTAKGWHQSFTAQKHARLTPGNAPTYISSQMYDAAESLGDFSILSRQNNYRVAVIDFKNSAYSQLYTQEGGAIVTDFGKEKLSSKLSLGQANLKASTPEEIQRIERIFGVNFGKNKIATPSIKLDRRAIKRVLYTPKSEVANLSDYDKELYRLIKSNKKYSYVFKEALSGSGMVESIKLNQGIASVNFVSKNQIMPGSREFALALRRFTGVTLADDAAMAPLSKELSKQGIHLAISSEEYEKMAKEDVLLNNFFKAIGSDKNKDLVTEADFGGTVKFQEIRLSKGKSMVIPKITNTEEAARHVTSIIDRFKASGDARRIELAETIEHGSKVITKLNLEYLGIDRVRAFNLPGFLRHDYGSDINIMKAGRIGPGKMRYMALGSKMLGYGDGEDPIYSALSKMWYNQTGFSLNKATLDLIPDEYAKTFLKSLTTPVTASEIQGKFIPLRAGPNTGKFSFSKGGVPTSSLKGTIFESVIQTAKNNSQLNYIDLGKQEILSLAGGSTSNSYRYIPVPSKYLKIKDKAGMVTVSKTHPGYGWVDILNTIQEKPVLLTPDKFDDEISRAILAAGNDTTKIAYIKKYAKTNLEKERTKLLKKIESASQDTVASLATKTGLLERQGSLYIKSSGSVRLSPQRTGMFTPEDLFKSDKIFDVGVSRSELADYLSRKKGFAKKEIRSITEALDSRGYLYVTLNANPTQRPEHISKVFRLVPLEIPKSSKETTGIMNLIMHPVIFKMFERDTDRDNIFMHFVDSFLSKTQTKDLGDRITRQQKAITPWLPIFEDITTAVKSSKAKGPASLTDVISSWLGSKASAAAGYTITRRVDRFMPQILTAETAEEAAKSLEELGVRPANIAAASDLFDIVRKPFLDDPEKLASAESIVQTLYQGGVQKAGAKDVLEDLSKNLVGLAERARQGQSYPSLRQESVSMFENYLEALSDKPREFDVTSKLLNKGNTSTRLTMGDLRRGAAELLADYVGAGYILRGRMYSKKGMGQIFDTMSVLEHQSIDKSLPNVLYNKVIRPILGQTESSKLLHEGSAFGKVVPPPSVASKTDKFIEMFNSNKATFLAGAILGAVGYSLLAPDSVQHDEAPLPPELNIRPPTDAGPSIPKDPARISPNYAQKSHRRGLNNYSSNLRDGNSMFPMSANSRVTIKDKRGTMSSHEMDRKLKYMSNSDYSY